MDRFDLDSAIREAKARYPIEQLIRVTPKRKLVGNGVYEELCPFHNDNNNPSLRIFTNAPEPHVHCFTCSAHYDQIGIMEREHPEMNFIEVLKFMNGGTLEFSRNETPRVQIQRPPKTTYVMKDVEPFIASMTEEDYLFLDDRLYIPRAQAISEQIGTVGNNCYIFPSQDYDNPEMFRALMLYDPLLRATGKYGPKKWRHWRKNEGAYVFRAPKIKGDKRVLIVEGAKDAERAVADGFNAVSLTNGAISFNAEWSRFFTEADEIYVALDWDRSKLDEKGREIGAAGQKGTTRITNTLKRAVPIDWSILEEKWGFPLRDFVAEHKGFDFFDAREYFSISEIEELMELSKKRYA